STFSDPELAAWAKVAIEVLARFGNLSVIPSVTTPGHVDVTLDGQLSVQPTRGALALGAAAGVTPLATIHQRFVRNKPTTPKPVFTSEGRQLLASLKRRTTFRAHFTLTPSS